MQLPGFKAYVTTHLRRSTADGSADDDPEQRAAALAKAAEVRQARSALVAAVRTGDLKVADLMERQDELAKRTKVAVALRALPGWGKVKVAACLTACGIDEARRFGGLTDAQRERLRDAVR